MIASLTLPTGDAIRSIPSTFPGAAPGTACRPAGIVAGIAGRTPVEAVSCPRPDGATITYSRWATTAESTGEVAARQRGADPTDTPLSWGEPSGPRAGPFVRTEVAGRCTATLGWDLAAYTVEVPAPDCDRTDRDVAGLAPPAPSALPA